MYLDIGYCFQHFRRSITVVLRKPGKDDYIVSKSYRLIVLFSIIGKVIESIVVFCISYFVEKYIFFSEYYVGGQRGCLCNYMLYLIYEQVYAAWRSGYPVVSLLTVDTQGVYDNVNYP